MDESVFKEFPVLKTARLTLKQVTVDNLDGFVHIAYYRTKSLSKKKALEFLNKVDEQYRLKQSINWGLFLGNELVGTCGYFRGFENATGEVGYMMRNEYQNSRYMTEALQPILDFGFEKLQLKCITAFTADDNAPSVKLLVNFGFTRTEEVQDGSRKFEKFTTLA